MNVYEIIGFVFGATGVWLAARQNILTWPVGLIGVLAYVVFFYQIRLYADMSLQVVYIGASVYGWYEWLYGDKNKTALPVSGLNVTGWLMGLFSGVILTSMLTWFFRTFTDASYPFFDSALAGFSLVAQVLLTRKKLENWLFWIMVDVGYIGLYLLKDAYLTAGLYAIFTALAIQGYFAWRKELHAVKP